MAEINTTDYKDIMNLYTVASQQLVGISTQYYDAAYEVVVLQTFDPEIDLLLPFYNAYLASNTAYNSAIQPVVDAIRELQDHVLRRARDGAGLAYNTINDWYEAEADAFPDADAGGTAVVTSEFAALSQQAGHRIEDGTGTDTRDFVA